MNASFKINRVVSNPNHEKINNDFDFFEIAETREDKYFEFTAKLLDDLTENKSIHAVQFHGGKKVYVMMRHNESNYEKIKDSVLNSKDADFLTYNQITSDKIEFFRLIQLFLNGLFRSEHPLLRYNNLGGHLYCFHSNWIKHHGARIWKIPTLDIKVTWDMNLTLDVCTFTDLKYLLKCAKEKGKKEQSKILDKPRYVLVNNNTMRRKTDGDILQEFVIGSAGNKKTNIKFIELYPAEKYAESKMGLLHAIVERFNTDYASYIDLSFASIENYHAYDFDKNTRNENNDAINKALGSQSIKIIDEVKEESSEQSCKYIQYIIKDKYKLDATIGKRPNEEALNISLIHEPEFYEMHNLPDPHDKIYENCSVQHITMENGFENLEDSLSNIMQNALIKKDIINHQITLFDWTKLNQTETISFVSAEKDSKVKDFLHYYSMDIKSDGSFVIAELSNTMFLTDIYQACIDIFQSKKSKRSNRMFAKGFIRDSLGNINVIYDTEMITLPDSQKIMAAINAGETNIKRASTFEEFYAGLMNIKMFDIDKKNYFCVGRKDKNPSMSIPKAVNIREIQPYNESQMLFDKLLPLMSVEFVRNKQLTVLPFPFKYLREWIEMNNAKKI